MRKTKSRAKSRPVSGAAVRFGIGYDIHRFSPGRKFVLGGVHIPSPLGLLGHSDADPLLHAICDALLGAAALGDIGKHFPDTNRKFKGISSLKLLASVRSTLGNKNYEVVNVDSTVILESPKISQFVPRMQTLIAGALRIDRKQVSVKATTNEGLGHLGNGKGCAAFAVASIRKTGGSA